jgi:hypothetical protein
MALTDKEIQSLKPHKKKHKVFEIPLTNIKEKDVRDRTAVQRLA